MIHRRSGAVRFRRCPRRPAPQIRRHRAVAGSRARRGPFRRVADRADPRAPHGRAAPARISCRAVISSSTTAPTACRCSTCATVSLRTAGVLRGGTAALSAAVRRRSPRVSARSTARGSRRCWPASRATIATWAIVRRLAGPTAGLIARRCSSRTSGSMIWTTGQVTGDGLAAGIAVCAVWAAVAYRDDPRLRRALLTGLGDGRGTRSETARASPRRCAVGWRLWSPPPG